MLFRFTRAATRTFAVLSLVAAANAGVTVVGKPGLGTFTTIQSAVDAASHGDVLLVAAGNYGGFTIDDKALTVIGQGAVNVSGVCTVKNLAVTRKAALIGLKITAPNSSVFAPPNALTLQDDAGMIRIQDCTLKGGRVSDSFMTISTGHGVRATSCQRVVIAASTLTGGDGGMPSGESPVAGGSGLDGSNSALALYDCTLYGGRGTDETYPSGGDGGDACHVVGWGVFVSGSTLRGGPGGGGDYIGCTTSGNGGDALDVTGAQLKWLDTAFVAGGNGSFGPCGQGVSGLTLRKTGAIETAYAGAKRTLVGPAIVNDNSTLSLTVTGTPGDRVWLLQDVQPAYLPIGPFIGVATILMPWKLALLPTNTIGASGSLTFDVPISDYTGTGGGWMWHVQALCRDATTGKRYLTTPRAVLVLDT